METYKSKSKRGVEIPKSLDNSGASSSEDDSHTVKDWNRGNKGDSVTLDIKLLGTREAERNLLILLNKRLERVIERNRELQKDNSQLQALLDAEKEKASVKVTKVTMKLNDELDKVRQDLANAKKEVTVLTFKLGAVKKEAEDAKTKADRAEAEFGRQRDKIDQLEKQVLDLTAQLKKAAEAYKKAERGAKEWETEATKQGQVLRDCKVELEKEMLAKHDLEKALKGQIDDKMTKVTIIEAEMVQMKASTNQLINEQNEKQQKEFDSLLENNMKKLRDEYNKRLVENKKEQSYLYATKEKDHLKENEFLKANLKTKSDQMEKISKEVKTLTETVRRLETERHGLLVKLDDLEGERKAERQKLMVEIKNRGDLIEMKIKEQSELVAKFQHLLDIKVALDNELAAYRTLLETEEARLKIVGRRKEEVATIMPASPTSSSTGWRDIEQYIM